MQLSPSCEGDGVQKGSKITTKSVDLPDQKGPEVFLIEQPCAMQNCCCFKWPFQYVWLLVNPVLSSLEHPCDACQRWALPQDKVLAGQVCHCRTNKTFCQHAHPANEEAGAGAVPAGTKKTYSAWYLWQHGAQGHLTIHCTQSIVCMPYAFLAQGNCHCMCHLISIVCKSWHERQPGERLQLTEYPGGSLKCPGRRAG